MTGFSLIDACHGRVPAFRSLSCRPSERDVQRQPECRGCVGTERGGRARYVGIERDVQGRYSDDVPEVHVLDLGVLHSVDDGSDGDTQHCRTADGYKY